MLRIRHRWPCHATTIRTMRRDGIELGGLSAILLRWVLRGRKLRRRETAPVLAWFQVGADVCDSATGAADCRSSSRKQACNFALHALGVHAILGELLVGVAASPGAFELLHYSLFEGGKASE